MQERNSIVLTVYAKANFSFLIYSLYNSLGWKIKGWVGFKFRTYQSIHGKTNQMSCPAKSFVHSGFIT